MSDKLVTSNGESVEIESVIEALETAPDKEEILQALKDLRRDKIKKTLGDTVRAAQFERAGLHLLQATRADVNRFKRFLLERYAANSVRLSLASCSSLYTYLEAERSIERSPFANIKCPPTSPHSSLHGHVWSTDRRCPYCQDRGAGFGIRIQLTISATFSL